MCIALAAYSCRDSRGIGPEGPHRAARPLHVGETNPFAESSDIDFRPDIALAEGDRIAFDIAGHGIADPSSMLAALRMAWNMASARASGDVATL